MLLLIFLEWSDWEFKIQKMSKFKTLTKEYRNLAYDHFHRQEYGRVLELFGDPAVALNQATRELQKNKYRKKLTQYGFNELYKKTIEDANREAETEKNWKNLDGPDFDWKIANTPRTHKEWFRGNKHLKYFIAEIHIGTYFFY